jgi:hypothetical protein
MPSLLLPIDERLNRATQLVIASRVYWDLWFYYDGADTPHSIVMTMQGFNEYFRFTPHAFLVAFIVYTAALFERRKDTMNLPTLAKEMKVAKLIPAKDVVEVDALLDQAAQPASKVAIIRNNLFAHRSATLSWEAAFKKAAISPYKLRDLTDVGLKIANRLLQVRGLPEQFFNTRPLEDAEAMLTALRR